MIAGCAGRRRLFADAAVPWSRWLQAEAPYGRSARQPAQRRELPVNAVRFALAAMSAFTRIRPSQSVPVSLDAIHRTAVWSRAGAAHPHAA